MSIDHHPSAHETTLEPAVPLSQRDELSAFIADQDSPKGPHQRVRVHGCLTQVGSAVVDVIAEEDRPGVLWRRACGIGQLVLVLPRAGGAWWSGRGWWWARGSSARARLNAMTVQASQGPIAVELTGQVRQGSVLELADDLRDGKEGWFCSSEGDIRGLLPGRMRSHVSKRSGSGRAQHWRCVQSPTRRPTW